VASVQTAADFLVLGVQSLINITVLVNWRLRTVKKLCVHCLSINDYCG